MKGNIMKTPTKFLLSLSCFFLLITAAQSQDDPFHWTKPISVEANDIFLLWQENEGANVYQKIYNYKIDSTWLGRDTLVRAMPRHEDDRGGAGTFADAATGRFNEDQYDDVVSIWSNGSGINIMLPQFDSTKAMWTNSIKDSIDEDVQDDRIYTRTGNFDDDEFDEFVVAWLDAEDSVHIRLYDTDADLRPILTAEVCDEKLVPKSIYCQVRYFIETGDLNADGTDELILLAVQSAYTGASVPTTVKIYDVMDGVFTSKAQTVIDVPKLPAQYALRDYLMAAVCGNFKTDDKEEMVLITNRRVAQAGNRYSYNYMLEASANLDTIHASTYHRIGPLEGNDYSELSAAAGDLNNDGRDEVVFLSHNLYHILACGDDLSLTETVSAGVQNGGTNDYTQGYNSVKVADTDQDGREDIILVKNFVAGSTYDGFFVALVTLNDELDGVHVFARILKDEPQNDTYHPYAVAVGNFDGYDFRIEEPKHYVATDVVQPIVILKAPPVHFDMFNDQIYDINRCYNEGDCNFVATYTKAGTTSVEVTTKVHKDWAISAGYQTSGSVQVSPMGVGITTNLEAHFLGNYGKGFDKDSTNITTITVEEQIQAREDDRIYSTITSYDVWEYPLYHGNETFARRSVMAVVPKSVQGNWYSSKSYNAISYIPNNEVGNILSYQTYDSLQHNPDLSQPIWDTDVPLKAYGVDGSSSNDWKLQKQEFASSQADTARDMGVDIGVHISPYSFDYDYSNKKVSTHSTSVTSKIDLEVHLGSLDPSIGDTKYAITPYAYWGTNDALIVDYAVEPELAPPGFDPTWWDVNYGSASDPTFVLPWKLDPEKGRAISAPSKRQQTKDIRIAPKVPVPGDTVTITTRVRNFSLVPTPGSVSVHFYIDDPDSGGTPIVGITGTNSVSTDGTIPARSFKDVELKWIMPDDLPSYPRIFAVLDENNDISEIHENNNKGFNVLGAPAVNTDIAAHNSNRPEEYQLYQSYPNPFNPTTNIKYAISKRDKVTLKVYDILGREVRTLVNKYQNSGTYIYQFDGSNLASGTYFYDLKIGDTYARTKKMLLIR
jgi:hypothetical protein